MSFTASFFISRQNISYKKIDGFSDNKITFKFIGILNFKE